MFGITYCKVLLDLHFLHSTGKGFTQVSVFQTPQHLHIQLCNDTGYSLKLFGRQFCAPELQSELYGYTEGSVSQNCLICRSNMKMEASDMPHSDDCQYFLMMTGTQGSGGNKYASSSNSETLVVYNSSQSSITASIVQKMYDVCLENAQHDPMSAMVEPPLQKPIMTRLEEKLYMLLPSKIHYQMKLYISGTLSMKLLRYIYYIICFFVFLWVCG